MAGELFGCSMCAVRMAFMDMCWLKPNIESHSLIDPEAMRDSRRRAGKFPTTDLSFPEKEKRREEQSRAEHRRERERERASD